MNIRIPAYLMMLALVAPPVLAKDRSLQTHLTPTLESRALPHADIILQYGNDPELKALAEQLARLGQTAPAALPAPSAPPKVGSRGWPAQPQTVPSQQDFEQAAARAAAALAEALGETTSPPTPPPPQATASWPPTLLVDPRRGK